MRRKRLSLITVLVTALSVTLVSGVMNYVRYGEHYREDGVGYFIAALAVTFLSAATACAAVRFGVVYFSRKKQEKIQKQLDEAERDE